MATRFYLPETLAGQVTPPAPTADWEHINTGPPVRFLLRAPDASALTSTAYTPDAADHTVDQDACHRQYVSEALAAQTITGNIKAQLQCFEGNAGNNLFLTLKVLVCTNSGGSTVGTALAITRDTTTELTTTTATNRNFPSTALTSTGVSAGDRLVIEIGVGGLPVAAGGTQGHNATLRWGCDASSGDLPEDDTQTGTTYRPWIEISTNLRFLGDETRPAITQQAMTSGMIGLLRK